MYLIMFLISEDEITLMMEGAENIYIMRFHDGRKDLMMEGAENIYIMRFQNENKIENAIFTLFMYVYDKALSFPFLPLPLLPFPGNLQICN